jgi:hypothetical protein
MTTGEKRGTDSTLYVRRDHRDRPRPDIPMPSNCPYCSAGAPRWKVFGPRAFCVACGTGVDTQPSPHPGGGLTQLEKEAAL